MVKRERYQNRIELLQGTLDLLILQTLQWGPRHGYGIARAIQVGSGERLRVDTGSLYPALHRLEQKRWIQAEWKTSENRQRVRVYRLTSSGKRDRRELVMRGRDDNGIDLGLYGFTPVDHRTCAGALRQLLGPASVTIADHHDLVRRGRARALFPDQAASDDCEPHHMPHDSLRSPGTIRRNV